MGKFWGQVRVWWQGKKTIVGGSLLVAAAVTAVGFGKLDPTTAIGVVGAGLSIAGYAAKANRHQAELLAALQDVAQVVADARGGNKAAAISSLENGVGSLAPVAIQSSAASLHLSADSASDLAAAVQHLAGNASAIVASGAAK